ncbi:MAG: glycosyltransferase [Lachnospiraceae bacterium]|nr:glycosyltransferase [Lachnospiraceae bacterium]
MILFLKGTLDTLNLFIDEMMREKLPASENGLPEPMEILDFRDSTALADKLIALDPLIDETTDVVTFNNAGIQLAIGKVPYWQSKNVRLYNILVDHPVYYVDEITKHYYPGMRVICIDKGHVDFLKEILSPIRESFFFLPHGGAAPENPGGEKDPSALSEREDGIVPGFGAREIDVLYIGSIRGKESPVFPELPFPDMQDFYGFCTDYYEKEPYAESGYAVNAYEAYRGIRLLPEQKYILVRNLMVGIESRIKRKRRIRLIESLADNGIPVRVFGDGDWKETADARPGRIIYGGMIPAAECLKLISKTKILLNDHPFFADGAHERIFNGMLRGAVVATNRSRYLEERFASGQEILYYDPEKEEDFAHTVGQLLDDEEELGRIAGQALRKAENDTWGSRLKEILQKHC